MMIIMHPSLSPRRSMETRTIACRLGQGLCDSLKGRDYGVLSGNVSSWHDVVWVLRASVKHDAHSGSLMGPGMNRSYA